MRLYQFRFKKNINLQTLYKALYVDNRHFSYNDDQDHVSVIIAVFIQSWSGKLVFHFHCFFFVNIYGTFAQN